MKVYCCGFLFSESKFIRQVLLIKKNRPYSQKGLLNGIGGHVEEGESPLGAMIREFQEETGVRISSWKELCILTYDFCCHEEGAIVYFFYDISDAVKCCSSKTDEEVRLIDVESVPHQNTMPNLKWLIPLALDETVRKPVLIY